MKFTQIRHGSHIITYKNKRFLVDPVLVEKGTIPALPKGRVKDKNPLLPLPFDTSFINELDAVIITHMHGDHFDQAAKELLPKALPVYCHPLDAPKIREAGFTNVTGIQDEFAIEKTIMIEAIHGGRHGVGHAGRLMGRTTGYVLKDHSHGEKEPVVYIIGDSIWCDAVRGAIDAHQPQVLIAFAGEARLPFGKPITMSINDLEQMASYAEKAGIIVNHMDAWNHCYLTSDQLRSFIAEKPYRNRFFIPKNGETLDGGRLTILSI